MSEPDRPGRGPDSQGVSGDGGATLRRPGGGTVSLSPQAERDAEGNAPRLQPGEHLAGRFTVLRFVAQGGMGAVYEANDVMLQSRVALKVLQTRVSTDAAAMERFHREVLLARRVTHSNVCRVYELYEEHTSAGEPIQFLTMEFLEGETLAARIARLGHLSTAEALPLVEQMCQGLAAAHAEDVIHRDFKSSNVMLVHRTGDSGHGPAEGTRVAITDFGVARMLPPGGESAVGEALTGRAGILGTPEYMAPEQVTGGSVTAATDLYALGVVMYEMVTGRLPFSGETPLATAARRINEPPPRPELAAPGLDPRWSRAILRCLDRDPGRRFQRAGDVLAALSGTHSRRRWLFPVLGAALVLLALAAGTRLGRWTGAAGQKQGAPAAMQASIAVLPFVDMSAERDQEFFSDGVAQEIINALAQVPGLRVAARTSSFSFKGKSEDLRTVGQKLDVAHVLEGSVRKSGSQVRITAELVNASSGYQVWSQTFDRGVADVFAVQDEIARAVVGALKMKVLPEGEGPGRKVTSPDAYTHYLRGLEFQNTGSMAGLTAGIAEYKQAITIDPTYAPAHARLAESLLRYGSTALETAGEAREWTRAGMVEAERAVELDPKRVDGYVARGVWRTISAWDWSGAREDLEHALVLSPGDANARRRYGRLLAVLGRVPEAITVAQAVFELDPLSAESRYQLANLYNAVGNYDRARVLLTKALEIAPGHAFAARELAYTELLDGHPAKALALFQAHDQEWVRAYGSALAQHSLGNAHQSQTALDHFTATSSTTSQYQLAQVHAWRGERDSAFAWLEKARLGRDTGLQYVKYDPFLRSLRGDPRYRALLETMNLPPD